MILSTACGGGPDGWARQPGITTESKPETESRRHGDRPSLQRPAARAARPGPGQGEWEWEGLGSRGLAAEALDAGPVGHDAKYQVGEQVSIALTSHEHIPL